MDNNSLDYIDETLEKMGYFAHASYIQYEENGDGNKRDYWCCYIYKITQQMPRRPIEINAERYRSKLSAMQGALSHLRKKIK